MIFNLLFCLGYFILYSKILVYTCVSTILALELLFQALRQYSNILAYTCVSTIFSSRTVIL